MNSHKQTYTHVTESNNLLGESRHRHFLSLQASFGFAQRGGVTYPYSNAIHNKRLVSNVNILNHNENKQLIFSESIFSN